MTIVIIIENIKQSKLSQTFSGTPISASIRRTIRKYW